MIKTLLIDDEREALDLLENLLSEFDDITVTDKVSSASDALSSFVTNKPDIVFIDIKMPGKDGLQLADEIIATEIPTTLIFATAHDEYAIEAIRKSAFDYLLKPASISKLNQAIVRYKTNRHDNGDLKTKIDTLTQALNPGKVRINTRTGYLLLSQEEIVYLKADGNYTEIVIDDAHHEVSSYNLGKIEKQLTSPLFKRIGRSVIINTKYLYKVDRNKGVCVLLKNNFRIELSIPQQFLVHLESIINF